MLINANTKKTFWIVAVPTYTNGGIPTHLPYLHVAAMGLRAAHANGCEEMVIEVRGMRPRRFTCTEVREALQQYPQYLGHIYQQSLRTPVQQLAVIAQANLLQEQTGV